MHDPLWCDVRNCPDCERLARDEQMQALRDRPPVLSVPHTDDCAVWLGHYSRATWNRCTCRPPVR